MGYAVSTGCWPVPFVLSRLPLLLWPLGPTAGDHRHLSAAHQGGADGTGVVPLHQRPSEPLNPTFSLFPVESELGKTNERD